MEIQLMELFFVNWSNPGKIKVLFSEQGIHLALNVEAEGL